MEDINFKQYLQLMIYAYNKQIEVHKIELEKALKDENFKSHKKCNFAKELREAIRYKQCMVYAREKLLEEL